MPNQMPEMGEPWDDGVERPLTQRIDESQDMTRAALGRIEDLLDRLNDIIEPSPKAAAAQCGGGVAPKPSVTIQLLADVSYEISLTADNLATRLDRLIKRL